MQEGLHGISREIANYKDRAKIGVIVTAAISILALAIAGLIMNASGVPWLSEEERNWDAESNEYISTYNSNDWEECCEETHDQIDSGSEEQQVAYDTYSILYSPMTALFVLAICFSSVMIIVAFVPVPRFVKEASFSLLGLSLITTGIFFVRKFMLWLSYYFSDIFNLNVDAMPDFHLHIMIYYGGLIGIFCIITGLITQAKIGKYIQIKNLGFNKLRKFSNTLLIAAMAVFLLSPIIPIAYVEYDQDYDYYNEETMRNGHYVFPIELMLIDDLYDAGIESGEDFSDSKDALTVTESYSIVETLYLSLIWICLGCLALLSLAIIPKIGFVFEGIAQVNILTIGIIIPIIIFTILTYVGIGDLDSDTGLYSSEMYKGANLNSNWMMPVCGIISIIVWILILVKSHIPWWQSIIPTEKEYGVMQQPVQHIVEQPIQQISQDYGGQPPTY